MLLFAVTGVTLNHAGDIGGKPVVREKALTLTGEVLGEIQSPTPDGAKRPLPAKTRAWLQQQLGVDLSDAVAEWSDLDVFVPMPRPGGDATLTIDRESGKATYETTDQGWIAYLNDLHKGRHTGVAWSWFIDLFAAACIVFTVTGLILLQLHARARPSTWPVVGLGLLIPILLMLLLVHR